MRFKIKSISKKINNKGMSIAELLIVVLILLFVSGGLVTTTIIAKEQYKEAMRYSEAKVLNSTISNMLVNELTNATQIDVDGGKVYYNSGRFTGVYSVENDGNGRVVLKNKSGSEEKKLLSDAAYTNDLKAEVNVKGETGKKTFEVTVKITAESDEGPVTYSNSTFTVINIASI